VPRPCFSTPSAARLAGGSLLLALTVGGCESRGDEASPIDAAARTGAAPAGETVEPTELVDPIVPSAAGEPGAWGFRQAASADLSGDGNLETVVLTARVETDARGRLAWDDGQPWQLYVEDAAGEVTLLYSRYVQLGTLTMRVTRPEELGRPAIVLLEHLPDQMTLYEFDYTGPGSSQTRRLISRPLDPRGEIAGPQLP
jgi:hypothetical protein